MKTIKAEFRFYEELNDFLPLERKKINFDHTFPSTSTIKDIIESLGVPHTEVDLILANGISVNFEYRPKENDKLSIYPAFELLNIANATQLRPQPLRNIKFILDTHLGKLARYLRLLGFFTLYSNQFDDKTIIELAVKNHYLILTRDVQLLKNSRVTHGYFVRNVMPQLQVKEILEKFDLYIDIDPLTRCILCNGNLEEVSKTKIQSQLEPLTEKYYDKFSQCVTCHQIYWAGSHYNKMTALVKSFLE